MASWGRRWARRRPLQVLRRRLPLRAAQRWSAPATLGAGRGAALMQDAMALHAEPDRLGELPKGGACRDLGLFGETQTAGGEWRGRETEYWYQKYGSHQPANP
jgi:hypothetical protein